MWLLVAHLVYRQAWQAMWVVSIVAGVRCALVVGVWYEGRLKRRLQATRRERFGANEVTDGGPTDADLDAGCDCQRPHGEGTRGVSNDCPLHG